MDIKKIMRPFKPENIKTRLSRLKKIDIKILVCNIIGTVVLLLVTYAAIAYSRGEFEIPFYDRNQTANLIIEVDTNARVETSASQEETTEDITNIQVVVNPDHLIEIETEAGTGGPAADDMPGETGETGAHSGETPAAADSEPAFELFSDEMRRLGFAVTDGVYEIFDEAAVNERIAAYRTEVNKILADPEGTDPIPPAPTLYEYKFVRIRPEYAVPDTRSTVINSTSRQTVQPFMDFIIIRSEGYEILCTAEGKVITRDFAALNFEILRMRDALNRTVFKSRSGDLYYIYEPDDGPRGAFAGVHFDPVFGDRGVPFMYPSYYGANGANNLERTRNDRNSNWGYADSETRRQIVSNIYDKTFNYHENIGVAYQDSPGRGNKLFFLSESGQNLLTGGDYYGPNEDEITVNHLGFFYFDHGLTRAYLRTLDLREMEIVNRETILQHKIDSRGYSYFAEFYIPEDYIIKAYSNGMILLEKDGYYGFMNYLGEWVAQPIYRSAQPFFEGVAVIGLENGKKALIDTKGNLLTRFRYDAITNCTGGIVALYERNEGWTILNKVRRQIDVE